VQWDKLRNICRRIAGHQGDDLFQHTYLLTYDKHPDNPEGYFVQVAKFQYFNPKSEFNKQHQQQIFQWYDSENDNDTLNKVHEFLTSTKKNHDLDIKRQLYYLYLHHGGVSQLSVKLGISRQIITKHLKEFELYCIDHIDSII